MSLGQEIQKARIDKHWNQQDLLRATGLSQAYLSAVERDKVDPRVSIVKRIARALGVTMDRLVPLDTDDSPPSRVGRTSTPQPGSTDTDVVQASLPLAPPQPQPSPNGQPLLCPQCVLSMVPLPDGQGYVCPACRYQVAGEDT